MLTYTGALSLYQTITKDKASDNTTFFNTASNEGRRRVLNLYSWKFLENQYSTDTVDGQQFYNLPYDFKKLITVTVDVSNNLYTPEEVPSRNFWDELNYNTNYESDLPYYYYLFNHQVGIYPTPSTNGNTIYINYKVRSKDVLTVDYTTGTITLTNNSTAVTGAGTTFTSEMVGRWIKGDTDGEWYRITAVASTTSLTIASPFEGTTIAGESYIIGDVGIIPEDYQILPVYYAATMYWNIIGDNSAKAQYYDNLFKEGVKEMRVQFSDLSENVDMPDLDETGIINPNLYVTQ